MSIMVHSWFKNLFLVTVASSGCILLLSYHTIRKHFLFDAKSIPDLHPHEFDDANRMAYAINTEGCTIPALKPFDEDVDTLMNAPLKFTPCPKHKPLVDKNNTHIWIVIDNLHYYYNNSNSTQHFTCCYEAFNRPVQIADITDFKIDRRVKYEPCMDFTSETKVNPKDEFMRVTCSVGNIKVYRTMFLFAPKKKIISHDGSTEIKHNNSVYNVIVLGLDSISRQHLYRAMPKTLKCVKKLGAIELLGYNKIGDNTFPNVLALLTGIKEQELKKTCFPHSKSTFDNCPFVWEWFKQAGYYTAYSEDSPTGIFNYLKRGFSGTPTDYYTRTFIYESKARENNYNLNKYIKCLQEKYFYQITIIDHLKNLITSLNSSKIFGLFWESDISHDNIQDAKALDDDYEELFIHLNISNYLNQTIVFFISDHGMRFGKIFRTHRGRLEVRLPFVYVLVPQSFRQKYGRAFNNLKLNSRRLTTPLDIHATLSDLVDLDNIKDENIVSRSKRYYTKDRVISLFLPIPGNRTCKTADIDDHWCACHRGNPISVHSTKAHEASEFLIDHLNKLLSSHRQCARLSVGKVIEAVEMLTMYASDKLVMVVIKAFPGGGVFEATVRGDHGKWALAGTVGRLNRYGEQSRCVDMYSLKMYCFCT